MKTKILIIVLAMFLLSLTFVGAVQPTQEYNKIFLNPFYRTSMTSGTNFTYNLTINPQDKISNVLSAIITLQAYISPTVTFTLWVNGQSCNNPVYTISTTFASAGQSTANFDCSNIINKAGNYIITIQPSSANVGASTAWLDLTYLNNPAGDVQVGGTEYNAGDNAKMWLQLLDSNKNAVNSAVCYLNMYSPVGATFLTRATMTSQGADGVYYYNLLAPNTQGVYPTVAICYYVATQNPRLAQSNFIYSGTVAGGTTLSNTNVSDQVYYQLTTAKVPTVTTNNHINTTINVTDFFLNCGNVSQSLITGLTLYWQGTWDSGQVNHNVIEYLWNYSSGTWITMPNNIIQGNANTEFAVTNSLALTNFTTALGINSVNPLQMRFTDTESNEGAKHFNTDYLYASCDQLGNSSYQQVEGSSEMHVSPDTNGYNNYIPSITSMVNQQTVNLNGTPTSYYTGYFVSNFTIASTVPATVTNDTITFDVFNTLPCNSVQALYRVETNGTLTNLPFNTDTDGLNTYCNIVFSQTLAPATNYNYIAYARNTWESDLRSTNTVENLIYPQLSSTCNFWAITQGLSPYPYIVPKNQTNTGSDYFYRTCANYYDDFYWFNQTYQTAITLRTVTNITNNNAYQQYESDYYSAKFAEDKLNSITGLATDWVTSTGMFSAAFLANPINAPNLNITQFFANISTTQYILSGLLSAPPINYSQIQAMTWNYSNRSLTYYQYPQINITNNVSLNITNNVSVNLNSSDIATAVWNYNGTISDNILSQIWNFANSIGNNILSSIASTIWNYNVSRNLTYTANTQINITNNVTVLTNTTVVSVQNVTINVTTQNISVNNESINTSDIAQNVWNYSARYTHGEILQ